MPASPLAEASADKWASARGGAAPPPFGCAERSPKLCPVVLACPPDRLRSSAPAKAGEEFSVAARNALALWFCLAAKSLTSWVIFIEQNLGPHMEQKCAVFAPSA